MKQSELKWLLEAWIISSEQVEQIKKFSSPTSWGFQKALLTIGAFLIGLWVLSFVALNRDGMSNLGKVFLLVWSTVVTYLWWWHLKEKHSSILWSWILFLSGLLLGASIFLIAQIYHLDITNDVLLGIRALMILPLVYVLKQKEYYLLFLFLLTASIITILFSHDFINPDERNIFVLYTLFWFLLLLVGHMHKKRYSDKMLSDLYMLFGSNISIIAYFVYIMYSTLDDGFLFNSSLYEIPTSILLMAVGLLIAYVLWRQHSWKKSLPYIMWLLVLVVFSLTIVQHPLLKYIIFIGGCVVWMYLWHTYWNKGISKISTAYLYIFVLYLYAKYGRNYGDKTLFFIGWWVLMMWLGYGFSKINKLLPKLLPSKQNHEE